MPFYLSIHPYLTQDLTQQALLLTVRDENENEKEKENEKSYKHTSPEYKVHKSKF